MNILPSYEEESWVMQQSKVFESFGLAIKKQQNIYNYFILVFWINLNP